VYCEKCDQVIKFLTLDQSVNVTGLGARTIFRLVETGQLHALETEEGYLILCPNSVALFVRL
jgi:tRNA A22 N-methylase